MARMRPRGWEGRRPRREDRQPGARPRGPGGRSGGTPFEPADLIARLDRLESVVLAIAAHLGVGPSSGGRRPHGGRPEEMGSSGPRPGAPERRAPERRAPSGRVEPARGGGDAHTVVRTVARGLVGRLKQYNPDRGYGFVVSADAPEDVFFHRSDCRMDPAVLEPSAPVTFDVVEMANGQVKATNLGTR